MIVVFESDVEMESLLILKSQRD